MSNDLKVGSFEMGLVLDGAPRAIIETPYLTSETRIALIAAYGAAVMHYERGIIAVDLLDRTAIIGCARDGMWVTIGNTHNPIAFLSYLNAHPSTDSW